MIQENILNRLSERDITQKTLCEDLGLCSSNVNAFLRKNRAFPYKTLLRIMRYLSLSVGEAGSSSDVLPSAIHTYLKKRMQDRGVKSNQLSLSVGVNRCILCSYLNGKRGLPYRYLDKILSELDLTIVEYKNQEKDEDSE